MGPPMLPVLSMRKVTSARQALASETDCAKLDLEKKPTARIRLRHRNRLNVIIGIMARFSVRIGSFKNESWKIGINDLLTFGESKTLN